MTKEEMRETRGGVGGWAVALCFPATTPVVVGAGAVVGVWGLGKWFGWW